MRLLLAIPFLLAPFVPTSAQSTVTPKDAVGAGASSPGVSALGYGFNVSAHHLQQLHDHDSFSHGTTAFAMRSIGFRMPNGRNTGSQGGARVEIAVQLSLAAPNVTANAHGKSFAQNRDASTTKLVFEKKTVVLPILGTPSNPSTGFDFKLPFDSGAFIYLPAQQRTLVLDIFNYTIVASSNGYYVDGWTRARSGLGGASQCALLYQQLGGANDFGKSQANGSYPGCQSSAQKTVTHTSDPMTLLVGHPHVFRAQAGAPQLAGVMLLGAQALNVGLPGTQCLLVNDPLLLLPCSADAAGDAGVLFFFPPLANFVGLSFYTQFAFIDLGANSLGLTTSNGIMNTLGTGFGDLASVDTLGRALIVQFE